MNCPRCQNTSITHRVDLADGLIALECGACHGHWLPRTTYGRWLEKQGERLPEKPANEGFDAPSSEPETALICPDCNHLLIKAKVERDLSFHLDRCFHCGGIWLDASEWDALESRHLHDEIHFMYTSVWQRKSREQRRPTETDQRTS